jgi:hypothetical protein
MFSKMNVVGQTALLSAIDIAVPKTLFVGQQNSPTLGYPTARMAQPL